MLTFDCCCAKESVRRESALPRRKPTVPSTVQSGMGLYALPRMRHRASTIQGGIPSHRRPGVGRASMSGTSELLQLLYSHRWGQRTCGTRCMTAGRSANAPAGGDSPACLRLQPDTPWVLACRGGQSPHQGFNKQGTPTKIDPLTEGFPHNIRPQ